MEKDHFSTFDAARICKVKYQRLREWIDREHVEPSIQKAHGIGTKALFSRQDLYLIALFEMLVGGGFSRDGAKMMIELTNRQLSVFKPLNDTSLTDHLIFIKFRVAAGVMRGIIPVGDEKFKKKSVFDLLTQGGYVTDALDYDKCLMVNFKRIRKQIDMAIG